MIGLSGANGTGKSTLARAFARAQGIPYVETSASEVFRRMGLNPKDEQPFEMRMVIQEMILGAFEMQFAEAQKLSSLYISDRTPIDLASYLLADVQRSTLANKPEAALITADYVSRCLKSAARFFSIIVVVQPGVKVDVEREGKARSCPAYMEHLNSIQLGLLCDERNVTRRFAIPRGVTDINDRLNALTNAVNVAVESNELLKKSQLIH
jgi:predicted ATPase